MGKITFRCTSCNSPIVIDEVHAGKRGRCDECGQVLIVPEATSMAVPPLPPAARADRPIEAAPHTTVFASSPSTAVQVNVQQPSRAAHSLGIASLVVGVLACFLCWIPLINLLVGGLGVLFGLCGLVLAIFRGGTGIGFSIAGTALSGLVCGLALGAMFLFAGIGESIDQVRKEAQATAKQNNKAEQQAAAGLEVLTAMFYWDEDDFMPEPIIEISVRNGTKHPISRAYFHGTLVTPGRTVPWVDEDFNYTIAGGLEPGETAEWRLVVNQFGAWQKAPRGREDLVLKVTPIRLDDAEGNPIKDSQSTP